MESDSFGLLVALGVLVALYSVYQNSGTFASIFLFPVLCIGFVCFFIYVMASGKHNVFGEVGETIRDGFKTVREVVP